MITCKEAQNSSLGYDREKFLNDQQKIKDNHLKLVYEYLIKYIDDNLKEAIKNNKFECKIGFAPDNFKNVILSDNESITYQDLQSDLLSKIYNELEETGYQVCQCYYKSIDSSLSEVYVVMLDISWYLLEHSIDLYKCLNYYNDLNNKIKSEILNTFNEKVASYKEINGKIQYKILKEMLYNIMTYDLNSNSKNDKINVIQMLLNELQRN